MEELYVSVKSSSMSSIRIVYLFCLFVVVITFVHSSPTTPWPRHQEEAEDDFHWVATWTAMPQLVEPDNMPPPPFNITSNSTIFQNSTLRQTLQISIGPSSSSSSHSRLIRLQISNLFSPNPLPISRATLAFPLDGKSGASSIDTSNPIIPLTFSDSSFSNSSSTNTQGKEEVTIPPNQSIYTDPISLPQDLDLPPQSTLAISLFFSQEKPITGTSMTGHPGSRTTSWMGKGDLVSSENVGEASTLHWYFLTAVEVFVDQKIGALVLLGDSITDGRGSTDDGDDRWPNLLFSRLLQANITTISVCNQAAGGNAVLPSSTWGLGPPLLERYERDLLGVKGVRWGLILEGVNDIGGADVDPETQRKVGEGLEGAYERIVRDAQKQKGIKMFGGTIMPFGGEGQVYSDPERERTRREVNGFITGGRNKLFDGGVVDFAGAVADPNRMERLREEYDGGDHLHPNVAGYRAMANAFPLELLV